MNSNPMLIIDGSQGEGGGQILRSSLALSMVTGQPFRIEKIRAGRPKPGLLRQHLTAVTAAARMSNAEVIGAGLGSTELEFRPQGINAGDYHFAIGSAGSTTLVLQTILPALIVADGPSTVRLEGGTHNPHAPPVDFLQKAFLPVLARMGPQVNITLERPGFFPAGGGRFGVTVQPAGGTSADDPNAEDTSADNRPSDPPKPPLATASLRLDKGGLSAAAPTAGGLQASPFASGRLRPIELNERGEIRERACRAIVAGLGRGIAEREARVIRDGLNWPPASCHVEELDAKFGPGNILMIELACEHITEVFTGFGMRGVQSEDVANDALEQAKRYLAAGVPVGAYLADQLLLPIALAGGGSFTTLPLTRHSTTNIDIVKKFLPVEVEVSRELPHQCRVTISRT